ncbi:hypothetical protein IWQ47_000998 [Aquimarina sp. EL_43]|uniref:hypothetical protein n=1 Tax=Aquimarina TaxID=290174 RepID=UPI0004715A33|nr:MULTISPECIES: hypothetical protein [Aquimarina]MBG6129700.1 hypothetical protein [Aquimarina sp. EL_35]MBG6150765.1 hypothetical protein [Aquimarina sp. EL_32]MBG6167928.1 hypothetical protein [Aquimarina sp. EL_43]
MPTGYSGTPLAKKLGIKDDDILMLYKQPNYYYSLFSDIPKRIREVQQPKNESVDFIHIFCTTFAELKEVAVIYKAALKKNGMLWVSWPKGSSVIPTDLKRDPIRNYLISIGLVDVKVAAIDKDWSGLKFVYRIRDRN